MKTLPDNPDPDHLRQQAKDLLAALRDVDPATPLAAAQRALARQYGFRTWTDLKAEVDRQRGGADTAPPALARAVAREFGLGAVTGEMRSLARADEMGRRWSLPTDQGRWAVRTMDTWWPVVDAETDVALQEAAAAAGVRLPKPVRTRTGHVMASAGGHQWRAYEWCHAGPPLLAPASAAVTREIGGVLATLHGLALPVDRVSPWHEFLVSPVGWPELATMAASAVWAAELADAVPNLAALAAIGADVPPPRPVLSHNALGPNCVRRGRDRRLVVLGWEHAGGQPPGWELAGALLDWAVGPDGAIHAAAARALVDGYRATAGTLPPLGPAMFRGVLTARANYLSGQIHGALAATGADPRFADRDVTYLLAHQPTPATLERLLDAAG